jgi:2-polyprenyl-6-methoxyphenol hydroxylase-like FAD-dependent oxidoreductase
VVVGAGFAGLLAACVLADHVDEVLVLDRDRLPDLPAPRDGAPQGRHAHPHLEEARAFLAELLPVSPYGPLDLPRLEHHLRRALADREGIEVRGRTSVIGLQRDAVGAVSGVRTLDLDHPGRSAVIDAELVVDASGHCSRTLAWLDRQGGPTVPVTAERVQAVFVTREFVMSAESRLPAVRLFRAGARTSALVVLGPDRAVLTLGGYRGERPPAELPGFTAYAAATSAHLAAALPELQPCGHPATCRIPVSVRRHFERLDRLPPGLLVMGDALQTADPMRTPGCAAAGGQAIVLRRALSQHPLPTVGAAFFSAWADQQ